MAAAVFQFRPVLGNPIPNVRPNHQSVIHFAAKAVGFNNAFRFMVYIFLVKRLRLDVSHDIFNYFIRRFICS